MWKHTFNLTWTRQKEVCRNWFGYLYIRLFPSVVIDMLSLSLLLVVAEPTQGAGILLDLLLKPRLYPRFQPPQVVSVSVMGIADKTLVVKKILVHHGSCEIQ